MIACKNEYGQHIPAVGAPSSRARLENQYPDTILLMRILYRDSSCGPLWEKLFALAKTPLEDQADLKTIVKRYGY